jgi:hypothetical protein
VRTRNGGSLTPSLIQSSPSQLRCRPYFSLPTSKMPARHSPSQTAVYVPHHNLTFTDQPAELQDKLWQIVKFCGHLPPPTLAVEFPRWNRNVGANDTAPSREFHGTRSRNRPLIVARTRLQTTPPLILPPFFTWPLHSASDKFQPRSAGRRRVRQRRFPAKQDVIPAKRSEILTFRRAARWP